MSQRLLISEKDLISEDDGIYDCIYTEESSHQNLLDDWIWYDEKTGGHFGPLKIFIRSYSLMDKFNEDFAKMNKVIHKVSSLNDVWEIQDNSGIIHLSESEEAYFNGLMKSFKEYNEKNDQKE